MLPNLLDKKGITARLWIAVRLAMINNYQAFRKSPNTNSWQQIDDAASVRLANMLQNDWLNNQHSLYTHIVGSQGAKILLEGEGTKSDMSIDKRPLAKKRKTIISSMDELGLA